MERITELATAIVNRTGSQSQQESRQPQDRQRKWACSGASVPPHIGHSAKVPSGDRQRADGLAASSSRDTDSDVDTTQA